MINVTSYTLRALFDRYRRRCFDLKEKNLLRIDIFNFFFLSFQCFHLGGLLEIINRRRFLEEQTVTEKINGTIFFGLKSMDLVHLC